MDTLTHNGYSFRKLASDDFSSLYYCDELLMAICTAEVEYIPIDAFKKIFFRISDMINACPIKHLIFDKRALRTFHQPSMEWYFTSWKPAIRTRGLTSHFKILPDLDWFRESVNAGRKEIFSKSDEQLLNGITITYVDSPEEAIKAIIAT